MVRKSVSRLLVCAAIAACASSATAAFDNGSFTDTSIAAWGPNPGDTINGLVMRDTTTFASAPASLKLYDPTTDGTTELSTKVEQNFWNFVSPTTPTKALAVTYKAKVALGPDSSSAGITANVYVFKTDWSFVDWIGQLMINESITDTEWTTYRDTIKANLGGQASWWYGNAPADSFKFDYVVSHNAMCLRRWPPALPWTA